MKITLAVILLCVTTVYGQDICVVWNFEDIVDNRINDCDDLNYWQHLPYASIDIEVPPDDLRGGTYYITPTSDGSCGITTVNSVTTEGVLEVNFYIETTEDFISNEAIACFEIRDSLTNDLLGNDCIYSSDWENGWHRIDIEINENSAEAYISFQGNSFVGLNFLMDSIRYVHITDGSEVCNIYANENNDEEIEGEGDTNEEENSEVDSNEEDNGNGNTNEEDDSEVNSDEESEGDGNTNEEDDSEADTDEAEEGDGNTNEEGDSEANTDEEDEGNGNTNEEDDSEVDSDEEDEGDENEPPIVLPTENDGLSTVEIIGIVFGSILIVIAIALLTYFLGLKQGTKKVQPPEYREDIQSHIMDIPRTITVPRAKIAGSEAPPLDYYHSNIDPQVYKLEIHNHFSR